MRTLGALLFVVACFTTLWEVQARASILLSLSDQITMSAPSATTTHTITFTLFRSIPASGKIVITPAPGEFNIPAGFDITDVDFAYATSSSFVERPLSNTADATNDGVSIVTGSSGSIQITLNSTTGIAAEERVRIKLGTNAVIGGTGANLISNPSSVGSHRIYLETRDASNATLDSISVIIAVVSQVSVVATPAILIPVLSNGLPSGTVAANNTTIEISLQTDIIANCRYSTTPGIAYSAMTNNFSPLKGTTFYTVLSGFQNATSYTYYVRCAGIGSSLSTDSDYVISFTLAATPSSNVSITEGEVIPGLSGNLGNGGAGDFPNGSVSLYLASVTFSGLSVPNSTISVLKDGKTSGTFQTRSDGKFQSTIVGLERGVYTFQLIATDSRGRTSAPYSASMSLSQGTANVISNIMIPPTISVSPANVSSGEQVVISGEGPPSVEFEVSALRQAASSSLSAPQLYTASSTSRGAWQMLLGSDEFSQGIYATKARILPSETEASGYSKVVTFSVGRGGACGASTDINADSKVNLIDFSIFLTMWGTDAPRADFNCDKQVNLADFSIMLFNWTG